MLPHVTVAMTLVSRRDCVEIEVWFWGEPRTQVCAEIGGQPSEAQRLFGVTPKFDERPEAGKARIYISSPPTNVQDESTWPESLSVDGRTPRISAQ